VAGIARKDIGEIRGIIARAKRLDVVFGVLGVLALGIGLLTFVTLFVDMALDGYTRLTPEFFTEFPSRRAERAGILSAWVGTTLVMLVTAAVAVPLGVASGISLEEYAPRNWITDVWRACRPSSTVCWRSACSSTSSASARASSPPA